MTRRERLKEQGKTDIVVIAVWAKGLCGVYDAEATIPYLNRLGLRPQLNARKHADEYLVDGGVLDNEYRILAMFRGGGDKNRDVTFICPDYYKVTVRLPSGYFPEEQTDLIEPGEKSRALEQLEDEIYRHTGVRDDLYRDKLVMAFCGPPLLFPVREIRYVQNTTGRVVTV